MYVQDGKAYSLTKGKIQLQSEAAEVYYKDIQIKNLESMPKEMKFYIKKLIEY
jgi:hypothetical protein